MTDTMLRQALATLTIASAAHHHNRLTPPLRVSCPRCNEQLPAGWNNRWSCPACSSTGDVVDYLRALGLSFAQARTLVLAEAIRWSAWEKRAVREALPMPAVLAHLGVDGNTGRIHCPNPEAHRRGDADPSCTVYPTAIHCFACGHHADIFAAWQQLRHTDFRTAWTDLLILAQQQDTTAAIHQTGAAQPAMRNGQDFVPLYNDVLDCCDPLTDTRGADYLTSRGINPAAAAELGVRWASNPALGRIQHLLAEHGPVAEAAGLADTDGRFTLRCHRLLFPSHRDGQVVWMQGRSTRQDVAKRWRWRSLTGITPWPTGLALLDNHPLDEPVYVTEGPTDWLALASRGRVVIGVPGAQAISHTWLRLLARRRIVLCHDPDAAGALGVRLWRERLALYRPRVQRLPLPPGTDLCDWLLPQSALDGPGDLPAPVALPDLATPASDLDTP